MQALRDVPKRHERVQAAWARLLPRHRLPVIVKTPMLILVGVYASGGRFASWPVLLTIVLASLLWTLLYAVNESSDLECESGCGPDAGRRLLLCMLCAGVCSTSAWLSPRLALLLALMALGQAAYCLPPLRLKRHWGAVLALSGLLNPILRLECGAVWGHHAIPPGAYVVFAALHLGASICSRCLLRDRDRRLGYCVTPYGTEWMGMVSTGVGLVGALLLSAEGVLPYGFAMFTLVGALFAVYAWSGRVTSIARLRKGWVWFALLSLAALAVLLEQK